MAEKSIGVPTVKGMKDAFKNAAVGGVGGLVYGIVSAIFGSGIFGAIGSTILAGSVLKEGKAEIIATISGFELGKNLLSGAASRASAASSSKEEVM